MRGPAAGHEDAALDPVREPECGRPMSPIRLIALDIDGTLLDSRWQVPEVNRDAIRDAAGPRHRGGRSSRGGGSTSRCRSSTQIDSPLTLIVSGGALVKARDGRTLCRHLLPQGVARRGPRPPRGRSATPRRSSSTGRAPRRSSTRGSTPRSRTAATTSTATAITSRRSCPLEAALTEDPIQVMFSGRFLQMRSLVEMLRALPVAVRIVGGHHRVRVARLLARGREPRRLHARARRWRNGPPARGIGRDAIMAVGDNLNDLDMLEAAGVPVVMGNAVDALKQLGWHITLHATTRAAWRPRSGVSPWRGRGAVTSESSSES